MKDAERKAALGALAEPGCPSFSGQHYRHSRQNVTPRVAVLRLVLRRTRARSRTPCRGTATTTICPFFPQPKLRFPCLLGAPGVLDGRDQTQGCTAAGRRRAMGVSRSTISRIWRAFNLRAHRVEAFRLSDDPLCVGKVHDIAGPRVNPLAHAVVLRVAGVRRWVAGVRRWQGAPLTGQAPRPGCVMLAATGCRGAPGKRERNLRNGRCFEQ